MILSGWGGYPRVECRVLEAGEPDELGATLARNSSLIARGQGRAYGDAALNPQATLRTLRCDRILAFDPSTGRITCEAGVSLEDIIRTFLPRGWFPPVTPGTKFVTIGGMIAADVHGKNHHVEGTFGRHVTSLELMLEDGMIVTCSRDRHADLFAATCGGMGLTGIILRATFCLVPVETPWIRQETLRCGGLDEVMAAFQDSAGWRYCVAWIDCLASGKDLGRSLLYRGEHALKRDLPLAIAPSPRAKRPLTVPPVFPGWALNRFSVGAFNAVYFRKGHPGAKIVDFDTFFYPLDSLLRWNRIYGRAGFVQYQCVLPKDASAEGIRELLQTIGQAGLGSFLAVLKLFGTSGEGLLSFPMEGYTLALDFPMRQRTLPLLQKLDAIVARYGGRIYLAKDACMAPGMLDSGYPQIERFRQIQKASGPQGRFSSLLSQRLKL
ncbi:FAD-binding oxidoreductase [Telmatospirillum sp.]|uniref:FAD-binding oxidoreductase n=1 Tax=Telmatospirillum sp. TaxID=2079197 RepID=UPI00284B68E4|nr:FAD-binding oxidoreductase [Telmatospirillum sp.]MDR3435509.1 FAD-binding oxidoreductase [Telmatospirillum sp.]